MRVGGGGGVLFIHIFFLFSMNIDVNGTRLFLKIKSLLSVIGQKVKVEKRMNLSSFIVSLLPTEVGVKEIA